MRLPPQVFIDPVAYRSRPATVPLGLSTTLAGLCEQAGIVMRATTPHRAILVYTGRAQIRTPDLDIVGVPTTELSSPEAALRALEALAHSFHDHAARECVCGRGLFGVDAA